MLKALISQCLDGKKKGTAVTKSIRAGLTFPVTRVLRQLKKGQYAERYNITVAISLTAVLEYMIAEVLELAGKATLVNNKVYIKPRHIVLTVHIDDELSMLLSKVIFNEEGVIPQIEPALFNTKKSRGSNF